MVGFEIAITCLALNIFKEARGEPIAGQQAVALVTLNRVREKGLDGDICKTVFEPGQFAWTATDTANGVLLPGKRPDRRSDEWQQVYAVAIESLTMRDFTKGATYFHEIKSRPSWVSSMQHVGRWGNHDFYKRP